MVGEQKERKMEWKWRLGKWEKPKEKNNNETERGEK